MTMIRSIVMAAVSALLAWLPPIPAYSAATPQANQAKLAAALGNILNLERPDQDGLATVWDGNKYVQCRRGQRRGLLCEAGGALMQPSLAHTLVSDRIKRLAELGWRLDPSFGNYVRTFPASLPISQVAEQILRTLADGYDADLTNLDFETDWIASEPCPPRNGPSQNLAGTINDAASMAPTAVHACAYAPPPEFAPLRPTLATANLVSLYGGRMTGELQRLRVNLNRDVFVAFDTGAGYIQCQPQTAAAIYCEAQSAESWSLLAGVLTPERIARLHAAGYAYPGRAPNYWKAYPLGQFDDATIAKELLALLHDVYAYGGEPELTYVTEKGEQHAAAR